MALSQVPSRLDAHSRQRRVLCQIARNLPRFRQKESFSQARQCHSRQTSFFPGRCGSLSGMRSMPYTAGWCPIGRTDGPTCHTEQHGLTLRVNPRVRTPSIFSC